jgi:hypothetical protein
MRKQSTQSIGAIEASAEVATALEQGLHRWLAPLLVRLDESLDKRLVRTVAATIKAIITHRNRAHGLLLSELGAFITSADHAAAGTKRLSNLLRSPNWSATAIDTFLADQADAHVSTASEEHPMLAAWDESIIEKPESSALEGLCAVRSQKARRLKRIKPGFYNPPGGRPVFVPGLNWMAIVLVAGAATVSIAAMRWWTTRGALAGDRRQLELRLLSQAVERWGRRVLHLFDRGFAGAPWLGSLLLLGARFVERWPKGYRLASAVAPLTPRPAWQLLRGKPTWKRRRLYDMRTHRYRLYGVVAIEVVHPEFPYDRLWLVASRPGRGRAPMYLLSNEPVRTAEHAWSVVCAYMRRWGVETTFRHSKSEMAMESPRVWHWDTRMKLLMLVALAYAFLLRLIRAAPDVIIWLLDYWCHRTGKRSRESSTPLYRARSALSRLWLTHPPSLIPDLTPG